MGFWALLPGRLAAGMNNNSVRSAEKLLGEPKRDIDIINNLQQLMELGKIPRV